MELRDHIRTVPNFPKPGVMFRDITPLLGNPDAFLECLGRMGDRWVGQIGAIAALDARGFIFGGALALLLEVPFIPIRKKGKLPFNTVRASYGLEYGEDTIEIHTDACASGTKVLLMDDTLATGGTAAAGVSLIEKIGAEVAGCAFIIELAALGGRSKLNGYQIQSLITYD